MNHLPKTTDMLHTLSLEQLNELKGQITQMIELKFPTSTGTTHRLSVGAPCTVDHHKVVGMIGKIVKVNRTRCKVDFNGTTFTVPKSMINLA